MNVNRVFWLVGILFLIPLMALGQPALAKEDTIKVAVGVDATSMDPPMSTNITDKNVTSHIYDTLLWRDEEMNVQPHLATGWKLIDDTTWDFDLREGITFHNGEPFNAEAVKFSIDRILDPDMKAPSFAQFTAISEVEAVGPRTVRIRTKEPYPVLPAVLAELWIVPPKYTEEKGKEELAKHPVGTGPFTLNEWTKDERIVLDAYPDYWNGAPKFDRAVFLPVPERGTRVAMLKTGEVDIVGDIPPYMVEDLERDENIDVITALGARAYFLGINNLADSPLRDVRVRRAVAHAIDVDGIIENTLSGYGSRLATLLTPRHFGYDPKIDPYQYDPELSKKLLTEAGYPDGFSVTFDAPNGRYLMDKEVAQVIAGQLKKVGLDVDLNIKEWGTYITQFRKKAKEDLAPLYFLGWSIPTFDADAILFALATPDKTYSRYHNDQVAEILTRARYTMDAEKREALYHEALALMYEDVPVVPLYQLQDLYGKRDRVHWRPRTDERILLHDAYVKN
jgi:peptide/nickel transport system substrate-binding protein